MPVNWNSLVQNPDFLPFFVVIVGSFIVLGVVAIIQWRIAQQAKYDAYLNERLIERGYSANEIITVVKAGRKKHRSSCCGADGYTTLEEPSLRPN